MNVFYRPQGPCKLSGCGMNGRHFLVILWCA